MSDLALARALACLQHMREELVVVGGTAHRFFPLHPLGREPGFDLLTTEDIDLAAPLRLGHDGSDALLRRLEAAGFQERIGGAEHPAHTYRLAGEPASYLQFIAPLTGSGMRRDGTPERLFRFSGIHAERLRHVDVLLLRPWKAAVRLEGAELSMQVVNPVAFLLQKLLVLPLRGSKRAKDLLYIHDTLVIFSGALDELAAEARELGEVLASKSRGKIGRSARELCFVETDASRDAARIAAAQRGRPPASAQIAAACRLGLTRLLGGVVPGI